jgi:carboxypeptidase C (cathepsin A)
MIKYIFLLVFACHTLFAEESKPADIKSCEIKEEVVETLHKAVVGGQEISYKARTGILPLCNKDEKTKATMFFVSYTKEGVDQTAERPITFCFNGGPGSSSVWLHMGVFGPKRVVLPADGGFTPPYHFINNDYSLLDLTDLVFIDPVSTGFSRAVPGEDPKQFHGVQEDVESIAEFIRLFTSRYQRWDSPKYLAGESYGTTRAAALALRLHDEEYYYLNGVILISSVLNFQTLWDINNGNDLPYILSLPSYTIAAGYHKKLPADLQQDLTAAQKASETFALNTYGPALLKGDLLPETEKAALVRELARFTGLSEGYILRSNLRVSVSRFAKELLRDKNLIIGRFDSRLTATEGDQSRCYFGFDPSMEAIAGPFCATFNQYVRKDLNWEKPTSYNILANVNWNYSSACQTGYLNAGEDLCEVMSKNPSLRVFVGSGYADLATPYFATDYTFHRLNLVPSQKKNIFMHYYKGGHMMYTEEADLIKLKKDLAQFFTIPK